MSALDADLTWLLDEFLALSDSVEDDRCVGDSEHAAMREERARAEQIIAAVREALSTGTRACNYKWASGEPGNPHECIERTGHLVRHACGCGVKG